MHTLVKTIDKAEADRLLLLNTSNRPVSKSNVETIKKAISSGEWKENGEAIKISHDGVLLDGQHRLMAISQTGIPVSTLVITGLSRDVFTTLDIGRARGAGDMLALQGMQSYNVVAAAVNLYLVWKGTGGLSNPGARHRPSKTEIVNVAMSDARFSDVNRKSSNFSISYMGRSLFLFLSVAFSEHDKTKSDEFFGHLTEPDYVTTPKVVMLLREQLIAGSTGNNRHSKQYKAALVFKAFSYFCSGKCPRQLGVRMYGDAAEKDIYTVRNL
jgi:hypothetical protein